MPVLSIFGNAQPLQTTTHDITTQRSAKLLTPALLHICDTSIASVPCYCAPFLHAPDDCDGEVRAHVAGEEGIEAVRERDALEVLLAARGLCAAAQEVRLEEVARRSVRAEAAHVEKHVLTAQSQAE